MILKKLLIYVVIITLVYDVIQAKKTTSPSDATAQEETIECLMCTSEIIKPATA